MFARGRESSLGVELTDGSGFTGALYLRDRFAFPAWPDVPPLTPAIATTAFRTDVPDDDWAAWWRALEAAPPARPVAPPPGSALVDLHEGVHEQLIRWIQRQEYASSTAMRGYRPDWLPPWIGASSARGRHVTEVVPVTGPWSLVLSPRRLLVSIELLRDHAAMDTLWREQLSALESAED